MSLNHDSEDRIRSWLADSCFLFLAMFVPACFAQQYEVGADIGYGVYRDGSIYAGGVTAQAGIRNRWRPFLDGGAGAKDYVIAGPAPYPQPFPQIASLITNDVWRWRSARAEASSSG